MIDPIEIKGIVRNTTKQNSVNGTMEEIVNLRRRDGNLEPMPNEQEIWKNLGDEILNGVTHAEMCSQFFIHHGKTYKHLMGIGCKGIAMGNHQAHVSDITNAPYPVYYIADIVDGEELGDDGLPIPTLEFKNGVYGDAPMYVGAPSAVVHQVGNLLTIHSASKLQYLLWSDGKYTDVTINWSGDQWETEVAPDFNIQLRAIPRCDKDGNPLIYATGGTLGEGHKWKNYSERDIIVTNAASAIAQARALAKQIGMINGYCIAVTALELYDGSYVCAGRPILLPKALAGEKFDEEGQEFFKYNIRLNNKAQAKTFQYSGSAASEKGEGTFYYETTYHNTNWQFPINGKKPFKGRVTPPKSAFSVMGACDGITNAVLSKSSMHNINALSAMYLDGKDAVWGVITGNDIQIKIPDATRDPRLADIAKNVCVFICDEEPESEIYNAVEYAEPTAYVYNDDGQIRQDKYYANAWLKDSGDKEIVERLEDKSVFYKVFTTPLSSIEGDKWIDINLRDKLVILEQLETLPVDSSATRNTIMPEVSYMYNGRLHVGDISEDVFKGFPLAYFEMPEAQAARFAEAMTESIILNDHKAYSGYAEGYQLEELWKGWKQEAMQLPDNTMFTYVIAHIKTAEGWRQVGRIEGTRLGEYYKLNPILFYPDSRCRMIQVGTLERDSNGELISHAIFYKCKAFKALEGSVHIELNPIEWFSESYNYEELDTLSSIERIYDTMPQNVCEETTEPRPTGRYQMNGDGSWDIIEVSDKKYRITWSGDSKSVALPSQTEFSNEFKFIGSQWTAVSSSWQSQKVTQVWRTEDSKLTIEYNVTLAMVPGTEQAVAFTAPPTLTLEVGDTLTDLSFNIVGEKCGYNSTFTNVFDVTTTEYAVTARLIKGAALAKFIEIDEDGSIVGIRSKMEIDNRPNILKVSATETPLYFPAINTYPVGNGEIRGLCSNTTALSTGQWGDAPLYVFASDGIYGLFVDTNGELVYPHARPISREVCINGASITPMDDAVVFASERGLMSIAGSQVTELSQPVEGRYLKFADYSSYERLDSMKEFVGQTAKGEVAWCSLAGMPTGEEFKEYLKNAIIGYNYDNRELWVANPSKEYIYIYTQEGWSKAMRQVVHFIGDYPSTYAVLVGNKVVDLSRSTKEVTDCFFLTRPIVLRGESAKHFTEAWIYGDFNVANNSDRVKAFVESLDDTADNKLKLNVVLQHKASLIVYGSADGAKYSMIGIGGVGGFSRNIIAKLHRMSLRHIRIAFVGSLHHDSRLETMMVDSMPAYGENSTIKPR